MTLQCKPAWMSASDNAWLQTLAENTWVYDAALGLAYTQQTKIRGAFRISTRGRKTSGRRPRGSRPEGLRAGVRFLERGSQPPPHQLGSLGSAVTSLSGVRGIAPVAKRVCHIWSILREAYPDTSVVLLLLKIGSQSQECSWVKSIPVIVAKNCLPETSLIVSFSSALYKTKLCPIFNWFGTRHVCKICYTQWIWLYPTWKNRLNAVVTCEIKLFQDYFSLRRRQRVETCLKLLRPLIRNYRKSVPLSHQHQTFCSEMRTQETIQLRTVCDKRL